MTMKVHRQYQKAENLPVTGQLDAETAGKLGVGSESQKLTVLNVLNDIE
jgi:hypothetical protein